MADKKNAPKKVTGDEKPADEALGDVPVDKEVKQAELPLETVKSDGIVAPVTVDAPDAGEATAPENPEGAEDGFAADQHVEFARRIYKQEPWVVKTALRDHNASDVLTKDDVRAAITAFLDTAVG